MSSNPYIDRVPDPSPDQGSGRDRGWGDSFWRRECEVADQRARRLQADIDATCLVLGVAGYYLSAACTLPDTDRLVAIADALHGLRVHLGLPPASHVRDGSDAHGSAASDGGVA